MLNVSNWTEVNGFLLDLFLLCYKMAFRAIGPEHQGQHMGAYVGQGISCDIMWYLMTQSPWCKFWTCFTQAWTSVFGAMTSSCMQWHFSILVASTWSLWLHHTQNPLTACTVPISLSSSVRRLIKLIVVLCSFSTSWGLNNSFFQSDYRERELGIVITGRTRLLTRLLDSNRAAPALGWRKVSSLYLHTHKHTDTETHTHLLKQNNNLKCAMDKFINSDLLSLIIPPHKRSLASFLP